MEHFSGAACASNGRGNNSLSGYIKLVSKASQGDNSAAYLRERPEATRVEHLSGTASNSRVLAFQVNIKLVSKALQGVNYGAYLHKTEPTRVEHLSSAASHSRILAFQINI